MSVASVDRREKHVPSIYFRSWLTLFLGCPKQVFCYLKTSNEGKQDQSSMYSVMINVFGIWKWCELFRTPFFAKLRMQYIKFPTDEIVLWTGRLSKSLKNLGSLKNSLNFPSNNTIKKDSLMCCCLSLVIGCFNQSKYIICNFISHWLRWKQIFINNIKEF